LVTIDANATGGSYKNALIAKLSMQVSEYYQSALKAANSMDYPSASYFSPVSLLLYL